MNYEGGKTSAPLVSVCIQTYQHGPFIREALESVLSQKFSFPYEILLGEDGSTDGAREVCIEFAKKHPEIIRLFLRDRKDVIYINGLATGRANFINNVTYVVIPGYGTVTGAAYWTDSLKLQKQIDILDNNPRAAGCFHETQLIQENGSYGKVYGKMKNSLLTAEDTITKLSPFHPSSFMFRRSLFPDPIPGWFKKVVSADMALFMLIANKGELISIPETMSVYRKHPGGISENVIVQRGIHDHRIQLLKYFDKYTDGLYRDKINMVIKEHKRDKKRNQKERFLNKLRMFFKHKKKPVVSS